MLCVPIFISLSDIITEPKLYGVEYEFIVICSPILSKVPLSVLLALPLE